ncbi:MAG: hypothetical protein AB1898_03180 [Acidobacteriota bacterium]
MKFYFVAKAPNSGFVGQFSIEEIAARLHANEFKGDYVATESSGPSYAELVKGGAVQWQPLSQLVARPWPAEPAAQPTAEVHKYSSAETRYRDGYLVARATASIGTTVKFIGIGLGVVIMFGTSIIGSRGSGGQFFLAGLLLGAIIAVPTYVLGVLVSAHAQVLKATLDTAVQTSPFLKKEDMARVMSL